jgi:predicted dehydrogenase
MRPVSVGVVGCGRAALDAHLPALARIAEANAVAVADPDTAALAAAERQAVPRRTDDYRELLAEESIEAICVATPTETHTEIALAALDAGKHVLVEKPLALSLGECDALVERAAATGLKATVGFNQRWHRLARRARTLIRGGRLGEISMLSSTFASPSLLRDVPPWRVDPARGGGLLALQAVHHLDLWRFLLDREIEQVSCSGDVAGPGGGSRALAIAASAAGGTRISGSFSAVTGQECGFAVYGEEAWLGASLYRFDSFELVPREATAGDGGHRLRRPARLASELVRAAPSIRRGGDFACSYQEEWRHLARAIRGLEPLECGLDQGRETTRALLAAQESLAAGRPAQVGGAHRE